jgi:hypothetical protein
MGLASILHPSRPRRDDPSYFPYFVWRYPLRHIFIIRSLEKLEKRLLHPRVCQ